jgi:hypothetical protein
VPVKSEHRSVGGRRLKPQLTITQQAPGKKTQ